VEKERRVGKGMGEMGDGEGTEEEKKGERHPPLVSRDVPSYCSAVVAPVPRASWNGTVSWYCCIKGPPTNIVGIDDRTGVARGGICPSNLQHGEAVSVKNNAIFTKISYHLTASDRESLLSDKQQTVFQWLQL